MAATMQRGSPVQAVDSVGRWENATVVSVCEETGKSSSLTMAGPDDGIAIVTRGRSEAVSASRLKEREVSVL